AEHRLCNGLNAVEIDFRRGERGLESRRPVITRPGVGQAPGDDHAIDVELELLDRDGLGAHRYMAGETQRTGGCRFLIASFAPPNRKRAGAGGLALCRSR